MSKPKTVVCVGKELIWNEKELAKRLVKDKASKKINEEENDNV